MAMKKVSKKASPKKPEKTAMKTKQPVSKTVKPEPATRTTDLPVAAVTRIAKASGAERVGKDAASIMVSMTEDYIGQLAKEAMKFADHAGRKTLKEEDIEMAAEKFA